MKTLKKRIKILIIAVVLIILLLVNFKSCSDLTFYKGQSENFELISKSWKDKYDQQHLVTQSTVLEKQELLTKYNTLSSGLKLKEKQLKDFKLLSSNTIVKVKLKTDTVYFSNPVFIHEKDSTNYISDYSLYFSFKDNWVDINGDLGNEDSISIDIKDSIVITSYTKRKRLHKETYIDVVSKNPYVTLTNLESYRLPQEKVIFTIAPMIGVGYDFYSKSILPFVGVGLQYHPFSIKVKKKK